LFQIELRIANERYLQRHPEVYTMLKLFCEEVLQHNPAPTTQAEIVALAKQFFANSVSLKQRVKGTTVQ
jgi:hypothetical protein